MREGPRRVFAPVCCHPEDHGVYGFLGGPVGYVEVDAEAVDHLPILAKREEEAEAQS